MQEHCLVLSLLPGRGESARDFMRQLAAGRRAEQERSDQRLGIGAQRWYLAPGTDGDLLVGVIDTTDLRRSLRLLAVSMAPHDLWVKRRLAELTGIDLNDAPELAIATRLGAEDLVEDRSDGLVPVGLVGAELPAT